ncbi:MoaD/ThiS family protein [Promethearchaeum syntrophicum]|uniref:MoaD/ThiS family protein n=1 Tax=Promethearchaeum syntrophicum TaxID=2594042 RepID=A0A5B9DEI3_9ARCH|nr:MoaD/ThiS family protein [Candidatus Prometheoarchaeum syntrophicum]QEE17502.1 hypothetical protein DSAG12_03339 [Candidatus Prometheoarchaeum syntrophicum]
MEHLTKLQSTGSLKSYRVKTSRTVADLLKDLKLESKFFAILVNGKKVNLNDTVEEGNDITILPRIAGGH